MRITSHHIETSLPILLVMRMSPFGFRIPHSAFLIPHSAFRIPHSAVPHCRMPSAAV
jgi:hypothetical protein